MTQNQCCKPAPECEHGYDKEHKKCFDKPCEWGYDDQVCHISLPSSWMMLIRQQNQCCKPKPNCPYGWDKEHGKCFDKPCDYGYDDKVGPTES